MLAPLLVAAYFVLTLALANSGEAHLTADLAGPLLIGAGVAFVAWSLASRLTRNRSKATVLATLTVFVFGVFGYFVKIVAEYAKVDHPSGSRFSPAVGHHRSEALQTWL
jgi:predicted PurR-regulated permease PerM